MRKVHEIAKGTRKGKPPIFISFIQHGNPGDGFVYENICPYCEQTLEKIEDPDDNFDQIMLFNRLADGMYAHAYTCSASMFKINVEKTKRPLGTDTLVKEI